MIRYFFLLSSILLCAGIYAKEFHVAVNGNDNNIGTTAKPFRTISKAASLAMPGDVIIVHAGTYREMIAPPRGGTSDTKRITYMAAPGEKVVIKGSEIVKGWKKVKDDVWKVQLPYKFFEGKNPFTERVYGDWFGGWIHLGEVYLNEKPLSETDSLWKIMEAKPAMRRHSLDEAYSMNEHHTWFSKSDSGKTTIYARFGNFDPNLETVEVNVRSACFYPKDNFINYITVKGFHMSMAASQWAAPTAEQPALIGTNWSKGWIIEDNVISNAKCSGITLGKDRATGDNMWSKDRSIDGSVHYNEAVHRVIANGWNKEQIGSHIVLNNKIFNCGQAGICGSFGGAWSQIYNNEIYNVYDYRPYGGAEMAGIKLHAAIDVVIRDNFIHNTFLGIWLDWMAQGTRVTGNLLDDNDNVDVFMEVNHGPYLIDNNIFLSTHAIQDWSQGGAYVNNLIGGTITVFKQSRRTPWFAPHTTNWQGITNITAGDDRFYNNVFAGSADTYRPALAIYQPQWVRQRYGMEVYDSVAQVVGDNNLYTNGAANGKFETNVKRMEAKSPVLEIVGGKAKVIFDRPTQTAMTVTTELLGRSRIAKQLFENADGTAIKLDYKMVGPNFYEWPKK